MNDCEAAGDLVLIQLSLLLSCKLCCCNSNYSVLTLQKHKGLYQNRVTGTLASSRRPGKLATTVIWSIVDRHGVLHRVTIYRYQIYTLLYITIPFSWLVPWFFPSQVAQHTGAYPRFPKHEATRSVSTPPWMGPPALNSSVPFYTPGWRETQ